MQDAVAGTVYQFGTEWRDPNGDLCNECVHTGAAFTTNLNSFPVWDTLQIAGRLPASRPGRWTVDFLRVDPGNRFSFFTDVIEISQPQGPPQVTTFSVTVDTSPRVSGLSISVDGQATPAGTRFTWAQGEQHSLSVPRTIQSPENSGTRYVFTGWSDGITENTRQITVSNNMVFSAVYKTQHRLTVQSEYGAATGDEWYDEGSKAYAELDTGTVADGLFYNWVFAGWTEDAAGKNLKSNAITMDAPKTSTATWNHEFSITFFAIIALVGVAAVAGLIFMRRARIQRSSAGLRASQPTPPVEAAQLSGQKKFCSNCRAVLPIEATICSSCGQPT
jgi:uncharacterized repeat protein (TIGR02543 family)